MKDLFHGRNPIRLGPEKVQGRQVVLDGEEFYCIANSSRLRPFLLSVVSSSDLWMFVSSNGGLTAGRRDPDLALFPYYTEDKIHDMAEATGPKTILLAQARGKRQLWEPFSERGAGLYRTTRNLYKSFRGNKIIFEEINEDLGLTFRYGWAPSERFGWIRQCSLTSSIATRVRLMDGLQNILPCGVGSHFQLEKSVLVDAYKKNELLSDCGLALFLLSSIPVDRPEPAESLRATVAWCVGLRRRCILLSSLQLPRFRCGGQLDPETDVRAERGAFFVESEFALRPGRAREWIMAADVDRGPSEVAELRRELRAPRSLARNVQADVAKGAQEIWRIAASADGLQKSARSLGNARHFGNVLFNVMRGGTFADGYRIDVADLSSFVRQANRTVAAQHKAFFRRLGSSIPRRQLLKLAPECCDPDLERLCYEYLPLSFSRRHGDPSRPWNRFSIAPARALHYEGNWRDIFQNWEALAVSFPGFVSAMICKFVNASTADGYNPYRITRDGFDWELHDPQDPWSHIGYWGDHQIIYLLRLLQILERHDPATLRDLLDREIFAFAHVPYKIKPYAELLRDPRDTVAFDFEQNETARRRLTEIGSDGKLLWDKQDRVRHANLAEKLLIPILAKFANFIPGAGIWLNTQRPEWNDANNALVGHGASMVTLYQLRRHLAFCRPLFDREFLLSLEVAQWLKTTSRLLLAPNWAALGRAGESYRETIYTGGFSGQKSAVTKAQCGEFFAVALGRVEETIRSNRRADGLYHSYNLVDWDKSNAIAVRRLPEMLEGQAAILGAHFLSAGESVDLLAALRRGAMYRPDQNAYLLYPDRRLPRFVEKNNLPAGAVARSNLLRRLLADGDRRLVERDVAGVCHFNPRITNVRDVKRILNELADDGYAPLAERDTAQLLSLFEEMFDHRSFTGRSGTFFGYEGLGCIYWHMVSKLMLSVQEAWQRTGDPRLADHYHQIRSGMGDFKTPEAYGAFPMDPYSHTPAHAGARQPGLTGQVKEDILCRFGELGVRVAGGQICFEPNLLRPGEFLSEPAWFNYLDVRGRAGRLRLKPRSLAFTYCQVPIVYQLSARPFLEITFAGGRTRRQDSPAVAARDSRAVFERTGVVKSILAGIQL